MNIGILLRGKSLEQVCKISKNFDLCYIVNNFVQEMKIIRPFIIGKEIIHFVNSMKDASLLPKQYKNLGIKKVQFSFTKEMYKRDYDLNKFYLGRGVKTTSFLPECLKHEILKIRNSGINCILHVSKLNPTSIWVAGLEFYHANYLVKNNAAHHLSKAKEIDMVGSFVKIVKEHPNITYHIVTYYDGLPRLHNLVIV